MNRSPRSRSAAACVSVALLAACSGDRPPSSDDLSSTMLAPTVDTQSSDAALPSSVVEGPCTPGEWITCHMYYRDLDGRLQCPASTALCRPDGNATYPCGDWVMTGDGPRPRDAGTDPITPNE